MTTTNVTVESVLWQDVVESAAARAALADLLEEQGFAERAALLRSDDAGDWGKIAWLHKVVRLEDAPRPEWACGAPAGDLFAVRVRPGRDRASAWIWEDFTGVPAGARAEPGRYCSIIGREDIGQLLDSIGEFGQTTEKPGGWPAQYVHVLFGHECCLVLWMV